MKKKAFLQALVLFLLLAGSWIVLLMRTSRPEEAPEPASGPDESAPAGLSAAPAAPDSGASTNPEQARYPAFRRMENTPPLWRDWMAYLQQQQSPGELLAALMLMGDSLKSMEPDEAVARIIELLLSGVSAETGMPFRVGEGGRLVSAGSMQALLTDWLGQIDPERAALMAQAALSGRLDQLQPEAFALHMRNFAWGTPAGDPGRHAFLLARMEAFLSHEAWMQAPSSAVAEAMDIAVYLDSPALVPALAARNAPGNDPVLRHATAIALERLVDRSPVEAARALTGSAAAGAMEPRARAALLARVDPALEGAGDLLRAYLAAPPGGAAEAAAFLQYFPNLNQSLSHNLLSANIPPGDGSARLRDALSRVDQWRADPALGHLGPELEAARERLLQQTGASFAP